MAKRRVERLSDLLRQEISSILLYKMNDPRLHLCALTDVHLSKDLRHAKIYVSVVGTQEHKDDCVKALNAATGFIRHELGRMDLKYIPTLTFYIDTGAEYSQHIEELLRSVRKDEPES